MERFLIKINNKRKYEEKEKEENKNKQKNILERKERKERKELKNTLNNNNNNNKKTSLSLSSSSSYNNNNNKLKIENVNNKIKKLYYLMETEYFNIQTDNSQNNNNNNNQENQENEEEKEEISNIITTSTTSETTTTSTTTIINDENDIIDKVVVQKSLEDYYEINKKLNESSSINYESQQPSLSTPFFSRVPSQFYQNPAQYSKPFHFFRSNISKFIAKKFETENTLTQIENNVIDINQNTLRNGGVTCLEFDPLGVLLLVGSANGLLRIYDTDEILFNLQKQNGLKQISNVTISPVYSLHTTKYISSLLWIPIPPYEIIAVGFLYSSFIDIIDCNTNEIVANLSTKYESRKGFTHLITFENTSKSRNLPNKQQQQDNFCIVAGNVVGQLFMWNYSPNSSSSSSFLPSSTSNLNTPIWETIGDPNSQPSKQIAFVGIYFPTIISSSSNNNNEVSNTMIISLTKNGRFCLWDIFKITTLSFSSAGTPTLLESFSLWEVISTNYFSKHVDIQSAVCDPDDSITITLIDEDKVTKKRRYKFGGKIYLTFSDGSRFIFYLSSKKCIQLSYTSELTTESIKISSLVQDELRPLNTIYYHQIENDIGRNNIISGGNYFSGIEFIPSLGSHIGFICSSNLPQIDILLISKSFILPPNFDQLDSSYWLSNSMITTSKITHTLTGNIYEALPGSNIIITTNDESIHLCPISQNNKNIVDNTSQQSSSSTTTTTTTTTNHQVLKLKSNIIQLFNPYSSSLIENNSYCIINISGCKIVVDRPYNGPLIKQNNPKVYLRTNLIPSSSNFIKNQLNQKLKIENQSILLGKISLHSTYPQIIRSHPLLPYLFIGNNDNTISIVTPESSRK